MPSEGVEIDAATHIGPPRRRSSDVSRARVFASSAAEIEEPDHRLLLLLPSWAMTSGKGVLSQILSTDPVVDIGSETAALRTRHAANCGTGTAVPTRARQNRRVRFFVRLWLAGRFSLSAPEV